MFYSSQSLYIGLQIWKQLVQTKTHLVAAPNTTKLLPVLSRRVPQLVLQLTSQYYLTYK